MIPLGPHGREWPVLWDLPPHSHNPVMQREAPVSKQGGGLVNKGPLQLEGVGGGVGAEAGGGAEGRRKTIRHRNGRWKGTVKPPPQPS